MDPAMPLPYKDRWTKQTATIKMVDLGLRNLQVSMQEMSRKIMDQIKLK